jgi:hypothetical protein
MTKTADKIIVALDVATKEKALELVEELHDQISFFKIGLQLYTVGAQKFARSNPPAQKFGPISVPTFEHGRSNESATIWCSHAHHHLSGGSE